jgi:hypothetical protein
MDWYKEAQLQGEELIIDPCNPRDPKILHTWTVIRNRDDIAVLTQWLGGMLE